MLESDMWRSPGPGLACFLVLLLGGCLDAPQSGATGPGAAQTSPADATVPGAANTRLNGHSSRDALDWAGDYSGTLPCASCPGIETMVTLHQDGTYVLSQLHIGESPRPLLGEGSFAWDRHGGVVTLGLDGGEVRRYQVGENRLLHLDRDGQRIQGELADNYVLRKHLNDPRIQDRRWVLMELQGQAVEAAQTGRSAFMVLATQGLRVSGSSSCNSFNGAYAILSGDRIRFARHMLSTRMACPDMRGETRFFEVLEMADSYSLTDDGAVLSLKRTRMAPLARFKQDKDWSH